MTGGTSWGCRGGDLCASLATETPSRSLFPLPRRCNKHVLFSSLRTVAFADGMKGGNGLRKHTPNSVGQKGEGSHSECSSLDRAPGSPDWLSCCHTFRTGFNYAEGGICSRFKQRKGEGQGGGRGKGRTVRRKENWPPSRLAPPSPTRSRPGSCPVSAGISGAGARIKPPPLTCGN